MPPSAEVICVFSTCVMESHARFCASIAARFSLMADLFSSVTMEAGETSLCS